MIQEISPYVYHNEYRELPPGEEDYVLVYRQGEIFLKETLEGIEFLTCGQAQERCPGISQELIYLFAIDSMHFYLALEMEEKLFPEYSFVNLRALRTAAPQYLAFAGVTGHQLAAWYRNHTYCGCCGTRTEKDHTERMLRCPSCGNQEYPKISPAVIVAIRNGNKLLLSKYEGRAYKRYALIAGFAEIGESIEDTVRREVMEEVGLRVKNITYYRSQPWSFSDTLLMGFYCDLDGADTITLDRQELALAQWWEREEIPDEGESISLTKEMMMRFRAGRDREPYVESKREP